MEEKKNPVGRPKKYTKEVVEAEAEALIKYAKSNDLPMLEEFCTDRDYDPSMLKREAFIENEYFSHAILLFKSIQKYKLVKGAIKGKFNPMFTQFAMKNLTDWRDTQVFEHAVEGGLIKYGYEVVALLKQIRKHKDKIALKPKEKVRVIENEEETD